MRIFRLLLTCSLALWQPVLAQEAIIDCKTRFLPVIAKQGMVARPEKLATEVGQTWLATGSPGGSTIITAVLQTIMNTMDFDMNIATDTHRLGGWVAGY